MVRMVVGFAFAWDRSLVLLIDKRHGPDVVKGKLNGIGGRMEGEESPQEAVSREFEEEAGLGIPPERWTHTATLGGIGWSVCFLRTDLVGDEVRGWKTMTDEKVEYWPVVKQSYMRVAPHLEWAVPLSASDIVKFPVIVRDVTP